MNKHQKDAEVFKCDKCNKSYTVKKSLQAHKRRNHQANAITQQRCTICGRCYKNKDSLASHTTQYHRPKYKGPVKCWFCKEQCPSKKKLRKHLKSKHSNEDVCAFCGYASKNLDRMEKHILNIHWGDENLKKLIIDTVNKEEQKKRKRK